ncbi:XRE family transcriptional regulator [Roseomonas gilardii]|uniref:XRE family transcriptional regulator n=1 Tax=Roseomonas gilardii TaxID=257708 RepID=A0ABU3MNJ2_9PROT|nr:helix-turn-helix domain-containing protein [Roseomonas gilardii]MDT8333881.1 XRE family transcriptional regulator [Roseomonas gilardii]
MMIDPDQIRAARALLRIEQRDLAMRAHVSVATVRRLEAGQDAARVTPVILENVRQVLEDAGAEFIEGGVRRRPVAHTDAGTLFEELRAISLRSAAKLRDQAEPLTEADLYDEDGLPA